MNEGFPLPFLQRLSHGLCLLFLALSPLDLAAAEVLRLSVVEKPSDSYPFGNAIHFYFDTSGKKAFFAGNPGSNRLRWGTYSLTNAQISKLESLFSSWYKAAQKVSPSGTRSSFRLVVHQKELSWSGYLRISEKGLDKEASDFLNTLLSGQDHPVLGAAVMEGEVSIRFACETLTRDGQISVLAKNTGKQEARINPLKDRVVAFWGHPVLAKSDAASTHILLPGAEKKLLWQLDSSVFRSPEGSAQLLFATEDLINTGLPVSLKPLYLEMDRCQLPGNLGSPKLDEPKLSGPEIRLKDIEARHAKYKDLLSSEQKAWLQIHRPRAKIMDACRIAMKDQSPSDTHIIKTLEEDKTSSSWTSKNIAIWGSGESINNLPLATPTHTEKCNLDFASSCFIGERHCLAAGQLPSYVNENGGVIKDATVEKSSDRGSICIDVDSVYNIQYCYSFDAESNTFVLSGIIEHGD